MHPKAPGKFYSMDLASRSVWLHLPPQWAVSGFVPVHKSSLPTPLPRSAHCEMFLFQNCHRNYEFTFIQLTNEHLDGQSRGFLLRIRDLGYARTLEWKASFQQGKNNQVTSEPAELHGTDKLKPTVQHVNAVEPSRAMWPTAAADKWTEQHSGLRQIHFLKPWNQQEWERIRG